MRFAPLALLLLAACGDLLGADFDRDVRHDPRSSPNGTLPNGTDPGVGHDTSSHEEAGTSGTSGETEREAGATELPSAKSGKPACEKGVAPNGRCYSWTVDNLDADDVDDIDAAGNDVYLAVRTGGASQVLRWSYGSSLPTSYPFASRLVLQLSVFSTGGLYGATTGDVKPVIFNDGKTWTTLAIDSNPFLERVSSIWAASRDDVYAVTDTGVQHYSASAWKKDANAVDASHVWGANGRVFVTHLSGNISARGESGGWTTFYFSPRTVAANAIGGLSADDFFVVGEDGFAVHIVSGIATEISTGTTESLRGVWGSEATGTWMVGTHGALFHVENEKLVKVPVPSSLSFRDVAGTTNGDVLAVGRDTSTGHAVVYRGRPGVDDGF